ncbi:MAG TPA: ATP-dependent DNA helicase RecG [Mycobacteriales bacterium]|nr:ATP-dependent DNA helicase RecG [Mycobacteriales bacterium]
MLLDRPLRGVVGLRTAKVLAAQLDLHTVRDLLHHYPRRYVQRGELTDLAHLTVGEHVTVQAEVREVRVRSLSRRPGHLLEVTVTDGRDELLLKFFNQRWRQRELRPGVRGLFAGKVEQFKHRRELNHPDYQLFDGDDPVETFAGALIPIYPATATCSTWVLARSVRVALDLLDSTADPLLDPLPADVRARHHLVDLAAALHAVHRPASTADAARGRARLKWDEAFVLQVALAQRRAAAQALPATPRPARPGGLLAAFDARLPFPLTAGQREVGDLVAADLAGSHPMHRLLQGEVGSGKTVVALRAMLTVVDAGGQAALLAPTEVLAQQHARSVRALLGPLAAAGELGGAPIATRVALLTGSQSASARKTALDEVASGAAGVVIGTHALLHEGVEFHDLGLVVVDEQHRFGVEQRDALRAKASRPPHVLVMTATPIPRTVAMTVYGDLETATLTELPPDRSPVRTHVVPGANAAWVERMWGRIRDEVQAGHQAYVVCPRIGGADDAGVDHAGAEEETGEDPRGGPGEGPGGGRGRRAPLAVLDVLPDLVAGPLAGLRVAALHGRLPTEEKDEVVRAFAAGDVDVLVATTVVEVGVDVANATVMAVLDADRYGVSQLHQLRGRVGRGTAPGWCLLHTETPEGSPGWERLAAVGATGDGFALARIDLEQRREGDVLGAAQSGRRSSVKLLSLLRDEELIRAAREGASALVARDPELADHPALAAALAAAVDEERAGFLEKA